MERYIKEYRQRENPEISFRTIHDFLTQSGFDYQVFEGEQLFKKGDGWVMAPNLVKVSYGPGTVRVEAWIKYAILPGVFAGEYGLSGFVGAAGKGPIKKAVAWLDQYLDGPRYALTVGEDVPAGRPLTPVPAAYAPQQPQIPQQSPAFQQPAEGVCPRCGTRMAGNAAFCGNCGSKIR